MLLSSLHDLPASNNPKRVLAHCPSSTAGLPITVMPIPSSGEFHGDYHGTTCILVAHQGHGRRWYRQGSVVLPLHTAPRMSLSRLAEEVGLSPQHFARLFKSTYGTTPHRYVQRLRIEAAVETLRSDPTVPIGQVARACGFASHSHMTELMRRCLGVRPSALRRDAVAPERPIRPGG